MDYVRNFQERYIVVALVDITQDINSQNLITNEQPSVEDTFDISYILENSITITFKEYINILPTRQTFFKADLSDVYSMQDIILDVEFTAQNNRYNWQFIFPSTTISFIINHLTSNYDDNVQEILDKESFEISSNIVNTLCDRLIENINNVHHEKLINITYKVLDKKMLNKDIPLNEEYLYKFVMFVEDQEIDIYINFDEGSMKFIKQIYMLGVFFGNQ